MQLNYLLSVTAAPDMAAPQHQKKDPAHPYRDRWQVQRVLRGMTEMAEANSCWAVRNASCIKCCCFGGCTACTKAAVGSVSPEQGEASDPVCSFLAQGRMDIITAKYLALILQMEKYQTAAGNPCCTEPHSCATRGIRRASSLLCGSPLHRDQLHVWSLVIFKILKLISDKQWCPRLLTLARPPSEWFSPHLPVAD